MERSLAANSEKHVKLTRSGVRKVIEGCAFETLAGVFLEC